MLKRLTSKRAELALEIIATIVLITGVALTSFNMYPANIYVSLAGNFLWFILGIIWRKWSLIIIQIVVTIIYLFGIVKIFFA